MYHKILVGHSPEAVSLKMGKAVLGLMTFYNTWKVCSMSEMHCFLVQRSRRQTRLFWQAFTTSRTEKGIAWFYSLNCALATSFWHQGSRSTVWDPGDVFSKVSHRLHRIPVLISNSWQGYCKDRGHTILIHITFLSPSRRYFKYLQNLLSVFLESWRGAVR